MHDSLFVKVSQRKSDLACIEFDFIFLESSFRFEKSVQLSSSDEWHHEEKSQLWHEKELHAHKELVLALEHDVLL